MTPFDSNNINDDNDDECDNIITGEMTVIMIMVMMKMEM